MPDVAIAAPSASAADAAEKVVERGGGAVDAALAAALVAMFTDIGIAAPGAGAFVTVGSRTTPTTVYDGYMAVPGLGGRNPSPVSRAATMAYGGGVTTMVGPASVAVPGAWAAFAEVHRLFGRAELGDLVAPAIDLVEGGFVPGASCLYYLGYSAEPVFGHDSASREVVLPGGRPLDTGETIRIPEAAAALRKIAVEGLGSVIWGDLGRRISADLRDRGSDISPVDFERYSNIAREPLEFSVDGWTVATNPPPAVGGVGLAALLAAGDSDPQAFLESQERLFRWRRGPLHHADDRTSVLQSFLDDLPGDPIRSPSTVHVSTADTSGLVCALTLSAGYGSGVIPTGTGLYMNNGMGELELVGHPERLVPGERLNSNMAPSILTSGDGASMAIGSPGADRITSAMASVIASMSHDGLTARQAVDRPRRHVSVDDSGEVEIKLEPGAEVSGVEYPIHRFDEKHMYFGGVGIASVTADGVLEAVSDPRRDGVGRILRGREN